MIWTQNQRHWLDRLDIIEMKSFIKTKTKSIHTKHIDDTTNINKNVVQKSGSSHILAWVWVTCHCRCQYQQMKCHSRFISNHSWNSHSLDKLLPQKYKKSSNQQFPKPSCSFAFQANITVQRHRLFSVFAASFVILPTISSRQLRMDRPAVGNMIAAKRSYKSPDITELDVEVRRVIRYTTPLDPKTMKNEGFKTPEQIGYKL